MSDASGWFELPCRTCRFFDGVQKNGDLIYYHCDRLGDWFFWQRDSQRIIDHFKATCWSPDANKVVKSLRSTDLRKAGFDLVKLSNGRRIYWARNNFLVGKVK